MTTNYKRESIGIGYRHEWETDTKTIYTLNTHGNFATPIASGNAAEMADLFCDLEIYAEPYSTKKAARNAIADLLSREDWRETLEASLN